MHVHTCISEYNVQWHSTGLIEILYENSADYHQQLKLNALSHTHPAFSLNNKYTLTHGFLLKPNVSVMPTCQVQIEQTVWIETCSMTSLNLHCGPINVAAVMILAWSTPSAQSYRPPTFSAPVTCHSHQAMNSLSLSNLKWIQIKQLNIYS